MSLKSKILQCKEYGRISVNIEVCLLHASSLILTCFEHDLSIFASLIQMDSAVLALACSMHLLN